MPGVQVQEPLRTPTDSVPFVAELRVDTSWDILGVPFEAWLGIGAIVVLLAIALVLLRRRVPAPRLPAPPPTPRSGGEEPGPATQRTLRAAPQLFAPQTPQAAPPREREAVPAPRTLTDGLSRTREGLLGRIREKISGRAIDGGVMDDLEEVLFTSDLGVKTAQALLGEMREKVTRNEAKDPAALQDILKTGIRRRLGERLPPPTYNGVAKPYVVMVVGVNGVGKTTTIGKLAKQLSDAGKTVLLGAGDTFRAAAAEQLEIWAKRAGADIVANKEGTDPSAVAFDAAKAAKARDVDVLIVDTAGRLHTKVNLMAELQKVKRVIGKEIPGAPHEVLLVVDATTGQNALNQAREFNDGVGVTGIVLTKLDGSAKGGIVVGIRDELGIPIRYVGIGEQAADLRAFDPDAFVDALFAPQ